MSYKKNSILEKIDEFRDEKPNVISEIKLWLQRIIDFIDDELPKTNKYQNKKKLLSQFGSDANFLFTYSELIKNAKKILGDLKVSVRLDSFEKFYIDLHPKVKEVSKNIFKDGHYSQAIFEAVKALIKFVSNKSKITERKAFNLMGKVFDVNNPILKLNDLKTDSDKDEQKGFRYLYQGAVMGIRNPKAHDTIKLKDCNRALEYLAFISLLFQRADEGKL